MKRYTTCPLCEASCGIAVEVRHGQAIAISPDPDDVLSRGHMCTKAKALIDLHEDPDRLREPVRKVGTEWEPIGWDEAFEEVGERLANLRNRHGRSAVGVYLGNPTVHNHEALLSAIPLLAALNTRRRFSPTSADQLPQMFAALHMFGHQLLLPIPDLDRTEHLIILGANPAASNGSLMTAPGIMRRLKAIQKRNGRVVVIDPRRTETAQHADAHHHLRPGSDAYLLLGMLHEIFERKLERFGHLEGHVDGLSRLRSLTAEWSPDRVASATGLSAETIRTLAVDFATAPRAAVYARIGLCTQRFGGVGAWLQYALNVVTGNLDAEGGMMFTRPAFDLVKLAAAIRQTGSYDSWRSRVSKRPEFAGEHSVALLAEEIETAGDGQIRGLITIAGNPVLSVPNGRRIDAALDTLDFMVCVDPFINETTRHADIILPPVSQLQRPYFNLMLGIMSVRHWAKYAEPVLPRDPGQLTDGQIMNRLTEALLRHDGRGLLDKARARVLRHVVARIHKLSPERTLDLVLRTGPRSGLSVLKLKASPHGMNLGSLEPVFPGRLYTRNKRIQLAPAVLVTDLRRLQDNLEPQVRAHTDGKLVLIGRRHILNNNSWMHNAPQLAGKARRCTLLMHPDDAQRRGLADGSMVRLRSRTGDVDVPLEIDDGIMAGVVSLPHGYGHRLNGVRLTVAQNVDGVSANDVTDDTFLDELTGTVAFNGLPVEICAGF